MSENLQAYFNDKFCRVIPVIPNKRGVIHGKLWITPLLSDNSIALIDIE